LNPEQATIRAFVVRRLQGLYLALLSDRNGRERFVKRLLSGRDIDPGAIVQIPDDESEPTEIGDRLRKLGAHDDCHVIAADAKLDGREFTLDDVLGKVVGKGKAAFVSCVPGRLGYFEGADGERFVLRSEGHGRKKQL
jgi:hypothetical protein